MQLEVNCPLILPDDALDSNALETLVFAWGRDVMLAAFAQAWQAQQPDDPTCPRCGASDSVGHGDKPYRLRTRFGVVALMRPRRRCAGCRHVFAVADGRLCPRVGRASAGLGEVAALAGTSWPFATAAWVLEELSGAPVSAEWLRQVTVAQGARAAARAETTAHAVSRQEIEVVVTQAPATVLVGMDGGWVRSRENTRGMEGKVGVVATGRERIGRTRNRLCGRRYAASFRSVETFAPLLYQAAAEVGVARAERVLVLGDGAGWISSVAEWCFVDAEQRLDLWHLLDRAGDAVRAQRLAAADARAVRDELDARLRRGEVDAALQLVAERLTSHTGQDFARYLRGQASHIVNAEALQAAGEVVGSGMVEKAVDLVINRRMKGRQGMSWSRASANAIVTQRAIILNAA